MTHIDRGRSRNFKREGSKLLKQRRDHKERKMLGRKEELKKGKKKMNEDVRKEGHKEGKKEVIRKEKKLGSN